MAAVCHFLPPMPVHKPWRVPQEGRGALGERTGGRERCRGSRWAASRRAASTR